MALAPITRQKLRGGLGPNRVQVYDTETGRWFEATRYPGPEVFGHGGGIVDNQIVIADGVKVLPVEEGDRRSRFAISDVCYLGVVDHSDVGRDAGGGSRRKLAASPGISDRRLFGARSSTQ